MTIGTEDNPGKASKTFVKVIKRGIFHPIPCPPRVTSENCLHQDEINTAKELPPMDATLVELFPYTGRRHQLRVHFKSIGHPIIGDYNYEVPFTDCDRMMLHAWKIKLPLSSSSDNINKILKKQNENNNENSKSGKITINNDKLNETSTINNEEKEKNIDNTVHNKETDKKIIDSNINPNIITKTNINGNATLEKAKSQNFNKRKYKNNNESVDFVDIILQTVNPFEHFLN